MKDHIMSYIELRTVEFDAHVDIDGNIVLDTHPDVLDIHESSIYCNNCGRELGFDDYDDHGISEDWELL